MPAIFLPCSVTSLYRTSPATRHGSITGFVTYVCPHPRIDFGASRRASIGLPSLRSKIVKNAPVATVVQMSADTPSSVDIAIVGGAMAGLPLAIGLQRLGVDAHVFEAAPQLRTDSGTVISIAKNGNVALEGISPGLSQRLLERGSATKVAKVRQIANGQVLNEVHSAEANGLVVVGWREAQETFAKELKPDLTHTGHRLKGFSVGEAGVEAEFEVRGDEAAAGGSEVRRVHTKLLIGADGLRSVVRKILFGDEPRYLRFLIWNALVPNKDRTRFGGHEADEIILQREPAAGISSFLLDAGEGQTFWQFGKRDPDEALSASLGKNWGGFGKAGARERVLHILNQDGGGPAWEIMQEAIEATDEDLIFERRSMDRLPLDKWSDPTGQVVLIGDAAHPMFPGPGEGARQAFEDAHQLLEELKAIALPALEPANIAAALSRFEERRVARCNKIQRFAAEGSGLPNHEKFTPELENLSEAESFQRQVEFRKWVNAYPEKWNGDPESKFWK
eukprot:TRINITY_DN1112_c0_g1_i1.p1 TRINITY_DN1112_c0_g1~~TRINITY_DN1112_c0_g1_i1.p1  ORF type:complete len:506 (-),score=67.46 TRINITY_DN1112_c0_g1_i1:865-2382(-)